MARAKATEAGQEKMLLEDAVYLLQRVAKWGSNREDYCASLLSVDIARFLDEAHTWERKA